jgi:dihydromethanopterin reductase (acceptor)
MNILWCITGAGEFLKESIEAMRKLDDHEITVFLSKAGEEVLASYNLLEDVKEMGRVETEKDFASSKAGRVALGGYGVVIVSPATANTVAKIANGIADNLVTTAVSLALKTDIKVCVVPTDWVPKGVEIPDVLTPGGSRVHMKPRRSDLRNIEHIEQEGIVVLEKPSHIPRFLKGLFTKPS